MLLLGSLGAGIALSGSPAVQAQPSVQLATIYSFTGDDGYSPNTLLQASDGNFYGTTAGGGAHFYGSVFRLTQAGALTTIYSFTNGTDGGVPNVGLVQAKDGNLYGTTYQGGANHKGTIFQLTPAGGFTLLHTLGGSDDGPCTGGMVQGTDGNLYGTSGGVVFQVTPAGGFSILHSFSTSDPLGYNLSNGLTLGSDGNFYGTTQAGGAHNGGTFFQITPAGVVTTILAFPANDGTATSALVQGRDGNFYGTTNGDETNSKGGTVFQLTTGGVETVLHSFAGDGSAGPTSNSALLLGNDGNLYGTTQVGGANDAGTLYEITAGGAFTSLYDFSDSTGSSPGANSLNFVSGASLVQGTDGSLYGTTLGGGSGQNGTIFKATVHPSFFAGAATLGNGVYYLSFSNGNYFGYYSYLTDPNYVYHFDLGYEYVFDANDGKAGVYLYDFKSQGFFYTSPTFPFPYLYDFSLNSVVYYYPDPSNAGHYNTDGYRFFYVFNTGKIISK